VSLSVDDVARAFVLAYKRSLKDEIKNTVLAPLDMKLAQFRRNGLKLLGEEQFAPILNRINVQLRISLSRIAEHESRPGGLVQPFNQT
jgi:hypothetical protein